MQLKHEFREANRCADIVACWVLCPLLLFLQYCLFNYMKNSGGVKNTRDLLLICNLCYFLYEKKRKKNWIPIIPFFLLVV